MTGSMQIPADFKYRDVFLKGRPVHDRHSRFYAKHPPMPPSRWAKIFSPFDALRGFSDAVASKEILYDCMRIPDEENRKDLDRKLKVLKSLTKNRHLARENKVKATVTYFLPCKDPDSEAFGNKGQYIKRSGTVMKVDTDIERTILIDDTRISLDDISDIETDIFFDTGSEGSI